MIYNRTPCRGFGISSLMLALVLMALAPTTRAESEPEAVAVAKRTLEAMGGAEAWAQTRFLSFNFFGFRTHHWDRYTGRHRLEGKTREGQSYLVLHDVDDRGDGTVFVDGAEVEGEDKAQWLERAYGAWINDTYWLLMPYKLLDPGVHLTHEGEEALDGRPHDKLKLTFGDVGLTPGDTYWAWIDRETGLMSRWAYHLESWEDEREPTAWDWVDWQSYGEIKLSPERVQTSGEGSRSLSPIAVYDELPDAIFESPAPME